MIHLTRITGIMPNSGRWLSAWSCHDAHDYSQNWARRRCGDPSLSFIAGSQGVPNDAPMSVKGSDEVQFFNF
jgi:hypothetical protein